MSDVGLNFGWPETVLVALVMGWPGFVVGLVLGTILWRRHPFWGALLGGTALDFVWFAFAGFG